MRHAVNRAPTSLNARVGPWNSSSMEMRSVRETSGISNESVLEIMSRKWSPKHSDKYAFAISNQFARIDQSDNKTILEFLNITRNIQPTIRCKTIHHCLMSIHDRCVSIRTLIFPFTVTPHLNRPTLRRGRVVRKQNKFPSENRTRT